MTNLTVNTPTALGFAVGNIIQMIFAASDPNYGFSGEYLVTAINSPTQFVVMYNGTLTGPVNVTTGTLRLLYSGQYVFKMIGPNAIDVGDGLAPVATVTDTAGGRQTSQQGLRNVMFNPGQATLEFFKNTVTETSEIPAIGEIVHLRYNHAGVAIGRIVDNTSVTAEAAAWGDSGHRAVLRKDMAPLPRTSDDCEAAAAALVKDFGYPHYEGSYTHESGYYQNGAYVQLNTGEPKSGTILKFQNLPATFLSVSQEMVTQVKTTLDHLDLTGRGLPEVFTHEVSFGHVDRINKTLRKFAIPKGAFVPQDSAVEPQEIDISQIGTVFITDVPLVKLIAWDNNFLTFDTQQDPPSGGGFEIRYTDEAWGPLPSKNLVGRITSGRQFQVPRSTRGKICCVRAFDASNRYSRFSSINHIAFPLVPQPPTAKYDTTDPIQVYLNITLPNVLADVWGVEIRDNDQLTVLYHSDLSDPTFLGRWPLSGNFQTNPPNLYVYTYNLLGEYSNYYVANGATAVPPPVTNLHVDDSTKRLLWNGSSLASNYLIEIDDKTNTFAHIIYSTVINNTTSWVIPDVYFFPDRFFRVTAFNAAGKATGVVLEHVYTPVPVDNLAPNTQIYNVDNNPTPSNLVNDGHHDVYRHWQWIMTANGKTAISTD